jgi:Cu+-exporting ATPase
MVALGRAAQTGILIRGGDTLERLQKVSHIAFDKTGTLTTGNLAVRDLKTFNGCSPVEAQSLIVALQRHSSHPIAQALLRAYDKPGLPIQRLQDVQETKGVGIQGRSSNGEQYSCGGARIAAQYNVSTNDDLVLFKDGILIASLSLQDDLRPEAPTTLQRLIALGLSTSLVSGDRTDKCEDLGTTLGIETVKAQQLPEQKLAFIHSLQETYPGGVAYVGDGINDAPTLAEASVGISLSSASDVAMHSAQVLLSGDTLARLPEAIALSRLTVSTIKQNLLWAFLYNVTCIPLAAGGFLTPLQGALLMTFSDVLIVGNSLRLKVRSLS